MLSHLQDHVPAEGELRSEKHACTSYKDWTLDLHVVYDADSISQEEISAGLSHLGEFYGIGYNAKTLPVKGPGWGKFSVGAL